MVKLCVAVAAAVLGMASASLYAEEVKLNDHDRMELRQRADSLRSSNMLGRDHDGMSEHMMHDRQTKMHSTKKHSRKHMRHGT
jgi:hypothetical protein